MSIQFCDSETGSRSYNANYTVSFRSSESSMDTKERVVWNKEWEALEEELDCENSDFGDNLGNMRNDFNFKDDSIRSRG